MFKKIIFTLLSFFYWTNITSNYQLSNNSDEQTIILLSIKNEINSINLKPYDKEKLNNIIKKYLDSSKSINSYLWTLKELKKALETKDYSFIPRTVASVIISLMIGGTFYSLQFKSNFIALIDEDTIKNCENFYCELKKRKNKEDFININNQTKESLKKIFYTIDNSILDQYFYCVSKNNKAVDFNSFYTDLLNTEASPFQRSLKKMLDDAKEYNNAYYSKIEYSLIVGLASFVLYYRSMTYIHERINNIQKLIDKAIQDAELTLKN